MMQKISVVNALLKDGNSKLADSLQKNDLMSAKVAQMMIAAASADVTKHSEELSNIQKELHNVSEETQKLREKYKQDSLADEPPAKKKK